MTLEELGITYTVVVGPSGKVQIDIQTKRTIELSVNNKPVTEIAQQPSNQPQPRHVYWQADGTQGETCADFSGAPR